ncbi:hypothetical protein [Variovorax sp. Sphag1AA]|uniref:hypothetical protein n=1 Tax=Variovorax sp. Sphag1AA TaxID=2587027 RepID=UPI00161D231F|nr:hypothetical protein [Variovorax sp. Sphag1AA]MBB3176348.1 hypothetical protein [Variovorax sp. Sphag1AA]
MTDSDNGSERSFEGRSLTITLRPGERVRLPSGRTCRIEIHDEMTGPESQFVTRTEDDPMIAAGAGTVTITILDEPETLARDDGTKPTGV